MTPEEADLWLKMMAKVRAQAAETNAINAAMSKKRREVMHQTYTEMGFEVDTKGVLKRMPYIDTTAKFVDVEQDFYDRT